MAILIEVKTGGGGNFTNLLAAVNSLGGTLTDDVIIECSGGEDVAGSSISINHSSTGSNYTLTIKPAAGQEHGGKLTSGIYRLVNTGIFNLIDIVSQNVFIEGITIESRPSANASPMIFLNASTPAMIDSCIFCTSGLFTVNGFQMSANSNSTIRNCLFFNFTTRAILATGTITIDNCTIRDSNFGIVALSGTINANNNLIQNSSVEAFEAGTYVGDGNISDDSSAADEGIGTGGVSVTFLESDSAIWAEGQPCQDAGIDLSGVGVVTDIIGTSRPQGSAYDVGAFELIVISGGTGYSSIDGGAYSSIAGGGYSSIDGGGYNSILASGGYTHTS